jgi:hypothetical protein
MVVGHNLHGPDWMDELTSEVRTVENNLLMQMKQTINAAYFMIYLTKHGVGTAIWEKGEIVMVHLDDDTKMSCRSHAPEYPEVIETIILKNQMAYGGVIGHDSFDAALQYIRLMQDDVTRRYCIAYYDAR